MTPPKMSHMAKKNFVLHIDFIYDGKPTKTLFFGFQGFSQIFFVRHIFSIMTIFSVFRQKWRDNDPQNLSYMSIKFF